MLEDLEPDTLHTVYVVAHTVDGDSLPSAVVEFAPRSPGGHFRGLYFISFILSSVGNDRESYEYVLR